MCRAYCCRCADMDGFSWISFLPQPTQQNWGPAYVQAAHEGQRSAAKINTLRRYVQPLKFTPAMQEEKQHLGGASRSDTDELSAVIDFGVGLWMQRERGAVAVVILMSSLLSSSPLCCFCPYDLETSIRVDCIGLITAK